ncbi:DUF4435 domain-containing protein [Rhodobacteraceae bacterium KMM 6894]|nr:DUF4435 domain-containing protein [Rhodobacteraceae bacterium KMM 6894]
MTFNKPRPTVDELYELLKRTTLPTILVEGKDDIVFYRKIEEALSELQVDVLPAGNKQAVLDLMDKLDQHSGTARFVYVVDKDLWVHGVPKKFGTHSRLVTTDGYSIENDLFADGDLESLLDQNEITSFRSEVEKFCSWYALALQRTFSGAEGAFRTHPGKVLDDPEFYETETRLKENEDPPTELYEVVVSNYQAMLRGKSLLSILHRQLSKDGRDVKFSGRQLMAFGGSRKGEKFDRLKGLIFDALQR